MPLLPENRIARRALIAGAAVAGASTLFAAGRLTSNSENPPSAKIPKPESTPTKLPLPKSQTQPSPEPTKTPELQKGLLWEIQLKKNFLFSNKVSITGSGGSTPSYVWVENQLFIRAADGSIQEIDLLGPTRGQKTGTPNATWKWDGIGMVLATDKDRVYIQSEENARVYIFDTKTKRELARILPPDGLSPRDAKLFYRWPGRLSQNSFIQTYSNIFLGGASAGVAAFTKEGKFLWQTPQGQGPYYFLDTIRNQALVAAPRKEGYSRTAIEIRDDVSGAVLMESAGSPHAHNSQTLITVEDMSGKTAMVYLTDLNSGKQQDFDITKHGGFFSVPPTVDILNGQNIAIIEGYNQYQTNRFTYFFIRLDAGENLEIFYEPRRIIVNGESESTAFLFWNSNGVLKSVKKDGDTFWKNDEVQTVKFRGLSGGNLIFANWDWNRDWSDQYPREDYLGGRPKIYGLDPNSGRKAWQIATLREKAKWEVVVRPKFVLAISGKEVFKIDGKTGNVELFLSGLSDDAPQYITDTGDIVLVEYPDSGDKKKLVAFRP